MSESAPIRLLLVDHQHLVRSGLCCLLHDVPDIELVGEASDGKEAVHLCKGAEPNVVVMELCMPIMDGITATRRIRQDHPHTQVLILTSTASEEKLEQALLAGAIGFILKNISHEAFFNSIREANQGLSSFAPEVTRALIRMRNSPPKLGHDLTEREQEVLILLADGLSNQEIALHYQISYSTVQFHVSNILSKLGVSNRVEAAAFAIRHHLV